MPVHFRVRRHPEILIEKRSDVVSRLFTLFGFRYKREDYLRLDRELLRGILKDWNFKKPRETTRVFIPKQFMNAKATSKLVSFLYLAPLQKSSFGF